MDVSPIMKTRERVAGLLDELEALDIENDFTRNEFERLHIILRKQKRIMSELSRPFGNDFGENRE